MGTTGIRGMDPESGTVSLKGESSQDHFPVGNGLGVPQGLTDLSCSQSVRGPLGPDLAWKVRLAPEVLWDHQVTSSSWVVF